MDHQINEQIRDREVRLIGAGGEQLGVMPIAKAQMIAREQDLDLVKIAPKADPPVCRVMDYGKFRFEQSKKDKEARKHQKTVELKEIRLSPGIDAHDMNFKARNAQRFLEEGDKVKVSIRFRGREMAHTQLGDAQMKRFVEMIEDHCVIEKPPKLEGRNMTMFLTPKPPAKPSKPETDRKETNPHA